mgnify:CR=1 FL=1
MLAHLGAYGLDGGAFGVGEDFQGYHLVFMFDGAFGQDRQHVGVRPFDFDALPTQDRSDLKRTPGMSAGRRALIFRLT